LGSSRRAFLKGAGFSLSLAALPRFPLFREDSFESRLAADPLRPQFHLLPAKNWMNDPNGPIFWNGFYHMFYQYNPNAAIWGDMHWNHAVSEDMIHWRHLPIALAPTPGWDDADGCFTGSAVNDNGTATILYTGVKTTSADRATLRDGRHNFREVQCLATSSDPQLRTWIKWKEPVIQPPNDGNLSGFRDPFLWREQKANAWYLGVASGQFKQGGRVLLYRSRDLRNWEYLHPLASGHWTEKENVNPVDSGEMWECPDFFPLGRKQVLLYSTGGQVLWETGELDPKELVFHPQRRGVLDHGAYYAQKTQLDRRGNRILWGWIPEKRPDSELVAAGWAGCMALPRVLSLNASDELLMEVVPQAEALRRKAFFRPADEGDDPPANSAPPEIEIEDLCGEIQWTSRCRPSSFTLEDKSGVWLTIDIAPKNSAAVVLVNGEPAAASCDSSSKLQFRLYLDGSVAELICNKKHAYTARIYRKPNGPLGLRSSKSPRDSIVELEAWQLKPISKDRLTS